MNRDWAFFITWVLAMVAVISVYIYMGIG
jgi:hypothetical protein